MMYILRCTEQCVKRFLDPPSEVFKQALGLGERDRATLAGLLIESLKREEPSQDLESAWKGEMQRRIRELDAGDLKTIPWEDVLIQTRASLISAGTERMLARIMRESPAAIADPAVLPGVLGSRTLRRTEQVRLRSEPLWLPGGTTISTISPRCLVHNAG